MKTFIKYVSLIFVILFSLNISCIYAEEIDDTDAKEETYKQEETVSTTPSEVEVSPKEETPKENTEKVEEKQDLPSQEENPIVTNEEEQKEETTVTKEEDSSEKTTLENETSTPSVEDKTDEPSKEETESKEDTTITEEPKNEGETPKETEEEKSEFSEVQKIKVITSKVDSEGNPLSGALLQIKDLEGNILDEWVSDGTDRITYLEEGTYILHEEEAPEGYEKAEDKEFTLEIKVEDLDAGVDFSTTPCNHYGGTPLYYIEIEGKKHEVYCINQNWETPDENSNYNGEIVKPSTIKDYTKQTVYVNADGTKEKIDISDPNLSSEQLYDKILDIIYHRYKSVKEFPDLSEAEIRYVTEAALKNYTNTGLTTIEKASGVIPLDLEGVSYYQRSTYVAYLNHMYRDYVYDPSNPNIYRIDIGKGDTFGQLARHWSTGHNAKKDPLVKEQVARYYELYTYLIGDDDHHPDDMNLFIYSATNTSSDLSGNDFDGGAYQNLLGITGYIELPDEKEQKKEITMVNEYSKEKREVSVVKVWQDKENYTKKRPKTVTVNLTVDDEIVDTVVLSEKNEWKHTFKDLDVYKEGKLIEYKINEIKVPEYDTFIEGDMTIGFTVINVNYAKGGDNPPTADFTIYYIVLLIASFLGIIKFSIVYIKNN